MNIINILLIAVLIFGGWLILTYNGLIKRRHRVNESWADIDVQLKRRYDLIPNLVETVKGYAAHEKEVFEKVTQARASAISAEKSGDPRQIGQAENMLAGALKTLFAVVENYPILKAAENFLELQRELRDTEDKIQAARRFYNSNVRDYNISIHSFPTKIIASALGFQERILFEITEAAERETPTVKF